MMTTDQAFRRLHDSKLTQELRKPMTLQELTPEVNENQWKMVKQVLVHDLHLTDRQQKLLDKLVG